MNIRQILFVCISFIFNDACETSDFFVRTFNTHLIVWIVIFKLFVCVYDAGLPERERDGLLDFDPLPLELLEFDRECELPNVNKKIKLKFINFVLSMIIVS